MYNRGWGFGISEWFLRRRSIDAWLSWWDEMSHSSTHSAFQCGKPGFCFQVTLNIYLVIMRGFYLFKSLDNNNNLYYTQNCKWTTLNLACCRVSRPFFLTSHLGNRQNLPFDVRISQGFVYVAGCKRWRRIVRAFYIEFLIMIMILHSITIVLFN